VRRFVRIDATGSAPSAWNARLGLFVRHPDVTEGRGAHAGYDLWTDDSKRYLSETGAGILVVAVYGGSRHLSACRTVSLDSEPPRQILFAN
jgi:hypothetical protein